MKKFTILILVGLTSFSATAQNAATPAPVVAPVTAQPQSALQQPVQAQPQTPVNPQPILSNAPTINTASPAPSSSSGAPQIMISEADKIPFVLAPQSFFSNSVSVLIPSTFTKADDALIKEKFPNKGANTPKIVMTDITHRPLLALNIAGNTGDRQDIVHFFRDIKTDLTNNYPTARFLKNDILQGRSLGLIEVILPNQDGKNIYNLMAFRYVGSNFLFLNFSCPEEDMARWQNAARQIAEGIKVMSN